MGLAERFLERGCSFEVMVKHHTGNCSESKIFQTLSAYKKEHPHKKISIRKSPESFRMSVAKFLGTNHYFTTGDDFAYRLEEEPVNHGDERHGKAVCSFGGGDGVRDLNKLFDSHFSQAEVII